MSETKERASDQRPRAAEEPTLEGAFSDDGVDLTVIRWMLRLTPAERLRAAQDLIDAVGALGVGAGDDP